MLFGGRGWILTSDVTGASCRSALLQLPDASALLTAISELLSQIGRIGRLSALHPSVMSRPVCYPYDGKTSAMHLGDPVGSNFILAGVEGFEPPVHCTKNSCLTSLATPQLTC